MQQYAQNRISRKTNFDLSKKPGGRCHQRFTCSLEFARVKVTCKTFVKLNPGVNTLKCLLSLLGSLQAKAAQKNVGEIDTSNA